MHGLYYTNDLYRLRVKIILGQIDTSDLEYVIRKHGYCEEVMEDEVHAYLGTDKDWLRDKGIDVKKYKKTIREYC